MAENEISVEYEILLCVKIDGDTFKVTRVVCHPDEANGVKPLQVYTGDSSGYGDGVEFLPEDHPDYAAWCEIASGITIASPTGEIAVPFTEG